MLRETKNAFRNAPKIISSLCILRRKEFVNFIDVMTPVSKKKKKKKQWVIETPRLCTHELVGPRIEAQDTAVHI
jgi:hypothetical protein